MNEEMKELIMKSMEWLGTVESITEIEGYCVVKYLDKDYEEIRYTGYLWDEENNKWRRNCVSCPSFELLMLNLFAKKSGETQPMIAANYAGRILGYCRS